jgi:hypothetical protein
MTEPPPTTWQLLILSLPSRQGTLRMRAWRALKSAGAAALRDGAYLLPFSAAGEQVLRAQADAVGNAGGSAHLFRFALDDAAQDQDLKALFDRSAGYGAVLKALRGARPGARTATGSLSRTLGQLRRDFEALVASDYFPGAAQDQARAALAELEHELDACRSPDEPRAAAGSIARLKRTDYQRRSWATRRHLWVDRAASAWLIRRFIDPKARFVWLDEPRHCPAKALGFDFDGAAFTHIGARVTFEVLLASFGLEKNAALQRLGTLVHYLDVGGVPIPEAAGFEAIMKGARAAHPDDDDALLRRVSIALDCLYDGYAQDEAAP